MTPHEQEMVGKVLPILEEINERHQLPARYLAMEYKLGNDGSVDLIVEATNHSSDTRDTASAKTAACIVGLIAATGITKYGRDIKTPIPKDGDRVNSFGLHFASELDLAICLNAMTSQQDLKIVMPPRAAARAK